MPPIDNDLTEDERAEFEGSGVTFDETPRDERGRFVPTTTAVPVTPAPEGEPAPAAPAAAVEEPPVVVPGAEPAPAVEEQPRTVPLAALHQERAKSAELAKANALAMARMNAILDAQRTNSPPPMPNMEEDPAGYIARLEERLSEFESGRQQEQANTQMERAIEADEASFMAYVPDYPQASEHYVRSRAAELMTFHTPQEAQQILTEEVRQVAQQAWKIGKPAAQVIYELSRARGYVPGQPAPAPAALTPPAPAGKPTPEATIESITAGQKASRTLSSAPGAAAAELNANALLNMSDDEFENYLKLGTKGANGRFAALAGN